jgi:hypothetical protein
MKLSDMQWRIGVIADLARSWPSVLSISHRFLGRRVDGHPIAGFGPGLKRPIHRFVLLGLAGWHRNRPMFFAGHLQHGISSMRA